jgi:GGDEF domain-containing protein
VFAVLCVLALVAGGAALLTSLPGPSLWSVVTEPGFQVLVLLVVVVDVYPLLPRLRAVPFLRDTILSSPLSIAALLAFGPAAVVVFPISGYLSSAHKRWWRAGLNAVLWGLQGLVAAAAFSLLGGEELRRLVDQPSVVPGQWAPGDFWRVAVATLVVIVVVEVVNVLLVGAAHTTLRAVSVRDYLRDCWHGRVSSLLALLAPLVAVLATDAPAALPLLAIAAIGAVEGLRAIYLRSLLAGRDPLTGVANRSAIGAHLERQLEELAGDAHLPRVAVLMVDIDDFKQVNDEHGHVVGDRVLVEVASRLNTVTRSQRDLVARFGGDEFAVLLGAGPPDRPASDPTVPSRRREPGPARRASRARDRPGPALAAPAAAPATAPRTTPPTAPPTAAALTAAAPTAAVSTGTPGAAGPPEIDPIAGRIADRIRHRIARPIDVGGGRRIRVSASVGWAATADPTTTARELFERADAELYRRKGERARGLREQAGDGGPVVAQPQWSSTSWSPVTPGYRAADGSPATPPSAGRLVAPLPPQRPGR